MSWWIKVGQAIDTAKVVRAISNASDEAVYEQVACEIERADIRRGLWVKALAAANGDEQQAKAEYIRLRVAQIRIQVAAVDTLTRADKVKGAPTQAMLPDRTQRPPGCYMQCKKCSGWNIELPNPISGQAPYCRDCATFLYRDDCVYHR